MMTNRYFSAIVLTEVTEADNWLPRRLEMKDWPALPVDAFHLELLELATSSFFVT
jgi:hypothetical protein